MKKKKDCDLGLQKPVNTCTVLFCLTVKIFEAVCRWEVLFAS